MSGIKNTDFFIAGRISRRREGAGRNIMVGIAAVTVAISVAVMIVSLAVISGFKREISDKIAGFGAHVQVVNLDGNNSMETLPILRDPQLEEALKGVAGFSRAEAYAIKGGIIKTDDAMQGVMLKGVDAGYDWSFFASGLVEGRLPAVGDSVRTKEILISRPLSRLLRTGVDDRLSMLFVREGANPRPDRFKVVGIYESGFGEMDMMMVPTDIRNVQRLNGWSGDQITGYELYATDFGRLERFAEDVRHVVYGMENADRANLLVLDLRERFPNLFDWLKAHNVNAAVIITIMLLVALLNMISALLIVLLERTRMIGILKALGMRSGSIRRIFLIRSGYILLKGMIWGNAIGIGLCLLQKYTRLVKLDQDGYFLSAVPIALDWLWLVVLNLASFALLLALLAIPTGIVSRITPDTTMRYQ